MTATRQSGLVLWRTLWFQLVQDGLVLLALDVEEFLDVSGGDLVLLHERLDSHGQRAGVEIS